jgi:hypothetical protein
VVLLSAVHSTEVVDMEVDGSIKKPQFKINHDALRGMDVFGIFAKFRHSRKVAKNSTKIVLCFFANFLQNYLCTVS